MKYFKTILMTAVFFTILTAFCKKNDIHAGEYVLIGSTFHLISSRPAGICIIIPGEICDYTKINPSGSNTDPSNFKPSTINARWEED